MDKVCVYNFLHKQIRNCIPGKPLQRRCIEALRRTFFSEKLTERYKTLAACEVEGLAEQEILAPARQIPAATLHCAAGGVPPALAVQARVEPETVRYTFPGGCCFRKFALDRERNFIKDATPPDLFSSDLFRNNKDIRSLRPRYLDVDAVALNTTHTDNYYHWFADLIGRLLLLPQYADKFICTDQRFPYQKETLRLLGIHESRVPAISDYSLYQFRTLTVLGKTPGPLSPSLRALQRWAEGVAPDRSGPRRLYISRKDSPGRRNIRNERAMLPLLREYGFHEVCFTGMSIARQIALLRNADLVAFPQGAAVINMAFCRPETRFLEVYSPIFLDLTGVSISTALRLEHHILMGRDTGAGTPETADYSVDLDELRDSLCLLVGD